MDRETFFTIAAVFLAAYLLWSLRFHKKRIKKIDQMKGIEFEEYLKSYFEYKGYKVELTKKSGDYGADLILKRHGRKTIVQAKRYAGNVGLSAVQEAVSAVKYYHGHDAMVITNSYFTKGAIELAKANRVLLWDRDDLLRRMARN